MHLLTLNGKVITSVRTGFDGTSIRPAVTLSCGRGSSDVAHAQAHTCQAVPDPVEPLWHLVRITRWI